MNDTAWIGLITFVLGCVMGVAYTRCYRDVARVLEREDHQKVVIEQGQEIARLRAQVALHIGKEKQ